LKAACEGDYSSERKGGIRHAIQSLYNMVKDWDRAMEAQEKRIREMEAEISAQKRLMAELEARGQGIKTGAPATGHS
jgi:predicted RNase H-like nuclease (RuvC/YqgF family)